MKYRFLFSVAAAAEEKRSSSSDCRLCRSTNFFFSFGKKREREERDRVLMSFSLLAMEKCYMVAPSFSLSSKREREAFVLSGCLARSLIDHEKGEEGKKAKKRRLSFEWPCR